MFIVTDEQPNTFLTFILCSYFTIQQPDSNSNYPINNPQIQIRLKASLFRELGILI